MSLAQRHRLEALQAACAEARRALSDFDRRTADVRRRAEETRTQVNLERDHLGELRGANAELRAEIRSERLQGTGAQGLLIVGASLAVCFGLAWTGTLVPDLPVALFLRQVSVYFWGVLIGATAVGTLGLLLLVVTETLRAEWSR